MSSRLAPRRAVLGWWSAALAVGLAGSAATAVAQVGPEATAAKLKPAEGLDATLWASEPMVVNPTNIDVDSRGRVWVSEGLNYRLTHGGKPFRKIDDADKIKILEDTDGDGRADKMTVFADHIYPIPMGLAVEERHGADGKYLGCKVYVGNSPDLLVLEDTDGDDKADRRYPLLSGFGGVDSDHGVHGTLLGIDGKLYFTHGDGCCSFEQDHSHKTRNFDVVDKGGRHVRSDQLANTLRADRDGTQFEVVADRQRNNYETSLNSFGNMFTSDNDDDGNRGCRVIWVMDGGHYGYRTPGSPRHWGEDVPGVVPKIVGTGNGSPSGLTVYEGSTLPETYRGAVLEADAGSRQINAFPMERHGAAFRTTAGVMLASDDTHFRPIDVAAGPDGSVFVADWYDAGVGGHNFQDQSTGRIYRVTPKGVKVEPARLDYGTVKGLIQALRSPAVAASDAARRGLIAAARTPEHGPEAMAALVDALSAGAPLERARALWVLFQVVGPEAAVDALHDADPRVREQAVRMLGRDDRDNGEVAYPDPAARKPAPASKHLAALLPLADDPDAGVRRELILALRNLPTAQVGEALKALTRSWDGRDRWYLEALGLALDARESDYVAGLFDGALYGPLGLDGAGGKDGRVALPPYFPVDRNEAYIPAGTPEPNASAVSKTLGLAWRLHRAEVLPLVGRLMKGLTAPELRQAADDVLGQVRDPKAVALLTDLAATADDPARKRQVLAMLARKLGNVWKDARRGPDVAALTESALRSADLRLDGVAVAAATGDPAHAPALTALAGDPKAPEDLRAAAVDALAVLDDPASKSFLRGLIDGAKARGNGDPASEAAVRSLARAGDARDRLTALIRESYPLGLRREALRAFARLGDGPARILDMAEAGDLPADLKVEASTLLATQADRPTRDRAARVLPLPKTRDGRPLPSFFEMVRKPGDAGRGQDAFFRAGANACSGCHRVQGRGQWVGPDLSTVGAKYGRDELLRSILNPSAAIGYNYRTSILGLVDGRVLSGLVVEDTPERVVLKTADGRRVAARADEIEGRKTAEVSLMPEGLAETFSDQELADLLSYLGTLRRPVSVVGQYRVLGPLRDGDGTSGLDPSAGVDPAAGVTGPDGRKLAWQRLDADAESLVDLTGLLGGGASGSAFLYTPVDSPVAQPARLMVDGKAGVKVWLNGKPVTLDASAAGGGQGAAVDLPAGPSGLLIRVDGGGPSPSLVTTFVSDQPLAFRGAADKGSGR